MELHITCIPGDGIGPEIVAEAKKVLEKIAVVYGHRMIFEDILMGGASIDVHGVPLTEEAIAKAKAADAVLMGSIGGDTTTSPWYKLPPNLRPEAGLLGIRKALNLFANLRPAVLYHTNKFVRIANPMYKVKPWDVAFVCPQQGLCLSALQEERDTLGKMRVVAM